MKFTTFTVLYRKGTLALMIIELKLAITKIVKASLKDTMKRTQVNSKRGSPGGGEVEENTTSYTKTDRNDKMKEVNFFKVQVPSTSLRLQNHCAAPFLYP